MNATTLPYAITTPLIRPAAMPTATATSAMTIQWV